jgi:hypothetical protein
VDNAIERVEAQADRAIDVPDDDGDRADLSLAAHFAFGAMAGSAYGAIARRRRSHPVLSGAGFGLLVWGSQYLGVLPAAGLLSNARHHPARRNALMIAAHLVWGAVLGAVADRLTTRNPDRHLTDSPDRQSA